MMMMMHVSASAVLLLSLTTTAAAVRAAGDADRTLAPPSFVPLPVGSITPKGWYLKQLELQADGLSGHLSQFWDDVMSSVWIGGDADGGLHERVPYWLNGIVPLAALLDNAGATARGATKGTHFLSDGTTVDVLSQARAYIDHVLTMVNATSGWIGPDDDDTGNQYWSKAPLMMALLQWAEFAPEYEDNVTTAIVGHLGAQYARMVDPDGTVLCCWSQARWQDFAVTIAWLFDHDATHGARGRDDDASFGACRVAIMSLRSGLGSSAPFSFRAPPPHISPPLTRRASLDDRRGRNALGARRRAQGAGHRLGDVLRDVPLGARQLRRPQRQQCAGDALAPRPARA